MAVFNKNSLTQVSGFDNPIIAGELVYNQKTFWNVSLTNDAGTAISLVDATINAQIIRRQLSNVKDTRYGLTFDIADYTPAPTAITLNVSNINVTNGTFTLVIDDSLWLALTSDTDLDIASINGAGFSGRIKISFAANGTNPAQDKIIFLLFIIRSDGVVN